MATAFLSTADLWSLYEQVRRSHLTLESKATNMVSGRHRSRSRGPGLELEELRSYQPGDDMRHIHWRVTARASVPMTKVFREERQSDVLVCVDRSKTMRFGTRKELKATTAARVAAIIAFSALNNRDRVGGLVMEAGKDTFFPYSGVIDDVAPFLQAAAAPLPEEDVGGAHGTSYWQKTFCHITNRVGSLYFISDFHYLDAAQIKILRTLARDKMIVAIQIIDPAEERLESRGRIHFISPTTGQSAVINTDDPLLRESFNQARAERQKEFSRLFAAAQVTLVRIYTNQDTLQALSPLISNYG